MKTEDEDECQCEWCAYLLKMQETRTQEYLEGYTAACMWGGPEEYNEDYLLGFCAALIDLDSYFDDDQLARPYLNTALDKALENQ